jgi:phage recombination protein Bet
MNSEISFTNEQISMIRNLILKDQNLSEEEITFFMYMAKKYGLDPIAGEMYVIKYKNSPAKIQISRDGYLSYAHRCSEFDGMESGTLTKDGELYGWCKVYRKDMSHPFYVEVPFGEYYKKIRDGSLNLWDSKPKTMIIKVAESQALRRAFKLFGIYSEDEIDNDNNELSLLDHQEIIKKNLMKEVKRFMKEKDISKEKSKSLFKDYSNLDDIRQADISTLEGFLIVLDEYNDKGELNE